MTRFQYLQKLQRDFWNRWSKECIYELQSRSKWFKTKGELKPEMLVLITENHLPPVKWRLGRIEKLYAGSDGISRVADVKTPNGIIRRSYSRFCPLLPEDNNSFDAMEDLQCFKEETC